MKKIIFIALLFVISKSVNAQKDTAYLAKKVLESFQKGDLEILKKLIPPPAVYRLIHPEIKKKTDKQIIAETSGSPELKEQFNTILANAKARKINLDSLKFSRVELLMPPGEGKTMCALTIYYIIDGKEKDFTIASHYKSNNWYFSHFVNGDSIFE